MSVVLELRCPEDMAKLLGKVRSAMRITDDLVELPCSNCARSARARGAPVARVLHRFNLLGELIETEVVTDPRPEAVPSQPAH